MEYNPLLLPVYNAGKEDHWGFYNGQNFWNGASYQQVTSIPDPSAYFSSREPDAVLMKAEILTKITYPTGGYSVFTFEPHDYSSTVKQTPSLQVQAMGANRMAGGLRIAKIESYDNISSTPTTKEYFYKKGYLSAGAASSGVLAWEPNYQEQGTAYVNNVSYSLFSSAELSYLNTSDGNHVTYTEITEKASNGYTVYTYQNHDNGFVDKDPFASSNHSTLHSNLQMKLFAKLALERGLLRSRSLYAGDKFLVKKQEYAYNTDLDRYNKYVRSVQVSGFPGFSISRVAYPLYTFYPYLQKETTTDYSRSGGQSTKSTEYFYYPASQLLMMAQSTNSDGYYTKVYTQYAGEYAHKASAPATDETHDILALKNRNMVAAPIEEITAVANGSGEYIVKGKLYHYEDYKPERIFELETYPSVPTGTFSLSTGNGTVGFSSDNRYKERAHFSKYDAKGNLVQYTRDGFVTSLLWGHNSTLPIAKALNATSSGNVADASQIAYNGYELGTLTGELGWEEVAVGNIVSRATDPTNVCAGKYAYRMAVPAAGYTSYSSTLNLYPGPQKGRYKMGCWVKTAPGFVEGLATIEMYAIKKGTAYAKYPVNAINAARFVIPNTNDKWKYFEVVLDFDAVKALVPTEELSIRCYTASRSTTPVYIDEVRICPIDAQMTTLTHELMVGPSSIVNPDNSAELYEYDGLGRLKLVKDPVGNILRSHTYKYKGQ